MAEAHAQLYLSTRINANSQSTICIPELYLAWLPDHSSSAYLVMEYIDIHHFASDEERARALSELIAVKTPPGVVRIMVQLVSAMSHNYVTTVIFTERTSPLTSLGISGSLALIPRVCFQQALRVGLWILSINTLYPFLFGGLSHSAPRRI
ncbi:hypothetical protein ASPVEDRAFT_45572 [Aspergillus versicolor CBS 583.65]|uniref:Protein kinase domain-containing protein n=1 Tax=Aspergillus versicolor CBS 583.65 TaxID=1036611 RepID=A0A1L9PXI3_ASPVE|nr:uncharacterized protein ASPVEDRAFT_45572 [Aspergillus versicolor CBS 583.65]OJJ06152.1 hypothetical protein ASPVEDRAFT_45572 [Aspergillus versicolor CBS 583.65]